MAQHQLAFQRQTRRRRPIKIAPIDRNRHFLADHKLLGGARQIELDPVRHEIIDRKRFSEMADRFGSVKTCMVQVPRMEVACRAKSKA